jgi:hypothetical protein
MHADNVVITDYKKLKGAQGNILVEALCDKLEGRRIDSQQGHCIFQFT